jgi:hypothetical protein
MFVWFFVNPFLFCFGFQLHGLFSLKLLPTSLVIYAGLKDYNKPMTITNYSQIIKHQQLNNPGVRFTMAN